MLQTASKPETRYYLEMCRPYELRPAPSVSEDIQVKRLEQPDAELRRWLYEEVGRQWGWRDRAYWPDSEWDAHVLRPDVEIWIAWLHDEPIGFFELEEEDGADVRITHFGLRPQFTGRGLGGHFLTLAIRRAWALGASRVWLHTSSFDHPHALNNYRARGFQLFKTEVLQPLTASI
jgi:GNAT superfamily N-acetyltransferase